MNSLPRWFGRKKSKDGAGREERLKIPLEISEPFAPVHCSGMSSISQSLASLASVNSSSENENLYVNGQVPKGQFKEYFMPPENQSDHKFAVPRPPTGNRIRQHVARTGSVHVANSRAHVSTAASVKRSSSIRSNIVINSSFLSNNTKLFVRQGSGRNSLLKKSLSVDDVLEESLNHSEEYDSNVNNYYNVQFIGKSDKSSSQLILNKENLEQHDQIYMEKLGLAPPKVQGKAHAATQGPDPLSTSYLGHTLISQVSDKDSEEDDKDSGALSMGGGTPC